LSEAAVESAERRGRGRAEQQSAAAVDGAVGDGAEYF
jgi:hypothetical protein